MKKVLTSLIAILFVMPVYAIRANDDTESGMAIAPGINGSEQCDVSTLGQSENNSTANVEADWTANTININWRDNGVVIAQNTCTYDDTITLPQEPTKTGYTFNGWVLVQNMARICNPINNQQTCANTDGCVWDSGTSECLTLSQQGQRMLAQSNCQYVTEQACTNNSNCSWNSETETCGMAALPLLG